MAVHMGRDRVAQYMGIEAVCTVPSLGVPIPMWDCQFRDKKICSGIEILGNSSLVERMGVGFAGNFRSCESVIFDGWYEATNEDR